MSNEVFTVDIPGFRKLNAGRPISFVVAELLQNALDEDVTRVDVILNRIEGSRTAFIAVEDDAPHGVKNLAHLYTLHAESTKVGNAGKRGRFNLGEKQAAVMFNRFTIESVTGGVAFDFTGTASRKSLRTKRERGSRAFGDIAMTLAQIAECDDFITHVLPPSGIALTYNGQTVPERTPNKVIEATLSTPVEDADGVPRLVQRKTLVEFHDPLPGEVATLYEMGLPVVATGDRWHINVMQRTPVGVERDNIPPAYLAKIRALCISHMGVATVEEANSPAVADAFDKHGDTLPGEVIEDWATLRFGAMRVAFDMHDREANHNAVSAGYSLVHGGSASAAQWDAMKRVGAIVPAGHLFPTHPEGSMPENPVPESAWSPGMRAVIEYARRIAPYVMPHVRMAFGIHDNSTSDAAFHVPGRVSFNLRTLGRKWFDGPRAQITDLIVHELAHQVESNHLDMAYHDELTRIAGVLVEVALSHPEAFVLRQEESATA